MKKTNNDKLIDFLYSRKASGRKLGLENIRNFLHLIGNPQDSFPSIHIAGTNGKGSTAAILESILRHSGLRTGLYTSPHLIDVRERIKICGKSIPFSDLITFLSHYKSLIEITDISFFEILTALAFTYFKEKNVDIAVLETGLGGRLDATNLVNPVLTVITEIGKDHTKTLGRTLKSITKEKAGILKPEVLCVAGITKKRVKKLLSPLCDENGIPVVFSKESVRISNIRLSKHGSMFDLKSKSFHLSNLFLRLAGRHQILNCSTAIQAVEELKKKGWKISENGIRAGLKNVEWRGRLELLCEDPTIVVDSAHNPMGIDTLVDALNTIYKYRSLILIFGVLKDKDYRKMFQKIAPLANRIILTKPLSDRALEPEAILSLPQSKNKEIEIIPIIRKALFHAIKIATKNDIVVAAGSIYFAGEVLRIWDESKIK